MSIFRSENLRNGPKERESRLSSARPMMEPKKKPSPRCPEEGACRSRCRVGCVAGAPPVRVWMRACVRAFGVPKDGR